MAAVRKTLSNDSGNEGERLLQSRKASHVADAGMPANISKQSTVGRRTAADSRHSQGQWSVAGSIGPGMGRTDSGSNSNEGRKKASVMSMNRMRSTASNRATNRGAMSHLDSIHSRKSSMGMGATETKVQREEREQQTKAIKQMPMMSRSSILARYVVEHKLFIVLTTLLTMFVLCADDVRLACTNQPADTWFNVATGFCLAVFSIEVILSCIGREDYFPGFFFYLDSISTVSLVIDITTINDAILAGGEEGVGNARGFEAAQLAKAGRVVRVLRLVRILKLYKALLEANQARKRKQNASSDLGDDEEDWDDIAVDPDFQGIKKESRVGKKLSDMTTRRVIVLVLVMLLVLPFLTSDETLQFHASPVYGADVVHRAFDRHLASGRVADRRKYELSLLQFIYYHNWFTGTAEKCPGEAILCSNVYLSYLFWVGIVSKNGTRLVQIAKEAAIESEVLDNWEANVSATQHIYAYGSMPDTVRTILSSRWDAACASGTTVQRLGMSMLQEEIDGLIDYPVRCPEDLRRNERLKFSARLVTTAEAKDWHLAFYFDLRRLTRFQSISGLLTTAFVTLVLTLASVAFTNDANTLVLSPVENMIHKVEIIRAKPLMAVKMADEEHKAEEIKKAKLKKLEDNKWKQMKDAFLCQSSSARRQETMETVVLEKTIIKLGSLLALGFGEAGTRIIEHNMHGVDSASVDAMVPGTRVECILGCARIKDFSIATDVLLNKVLTFVNQIAEIVHGVVDEYHGAANRNSGDMFLVIWRTSDDEEDATKLADMSMLASARILGSVHASPILAEYRRHPGFQQRLGRHCRVNLGFGLHYGWAIEGAVGSEFKIDASYLSPNLTIAESLERSTPIYGVKVLLTESVVNMCSLGMASKCRQIDCVVMTGSRDPMELYVIDLDCIGLSVAETRPKGFLWSSKQRFRVRQFLETEKRLKWDDQNDMVTVFNEHPDIAAMRWRFTAEFIHVFNMGCQNYFEGEWDVAKGFLRRTRRMLGIEDGPSTALLNFMKQENFEAPSSWKGHRELNPDLQSS